MILTTGLLLVTGLADQASGSDALSDEKSLWPRNANENTKSSHGAILAKFKNQKAKKHWMTLQRPGSENCWRKYDCCLDRTVRYPGITCPLCHPRYPAMTAEKDREPHISRSRKLHSRGHSAPQ